MKSLIAAVSLLAATSAFALADLKVTLEAPAVADRGASFVARATVENAGPGEAFDTTFSLAIRASYSTIASCHDRSALGTLTPGEKRVFDCAAVIPANGPRLFALDAIASVQSPTDDPNRNDNQAYVAATVASTGPDVAMYLSTPNRSALPPALPVPVALRFRNMARSSATGLSAVVDAPHGFGRLPASCTVAGARATCSLADLPPIEDVSSAQSLELEVLTPDVSEATSFVVRASVASAQTDTAPDDNSSVVELRTIETIFVTSTADSGDGSLRAAIERANGAIATPLLIAFRIGKAEKGWHTISPASPLPVVTSRNVSIDGTTQADYFGDTNPLGPEIEIDGSSTSAANGLELLPTCGASVRGLAINGFDGAGIAAGLQGPCGEAGATPNHIEKNYLGLDPTGTRALPNGRGITLSAGYRIHGNVISGNRRAGIFATSGASHIEQNIIGLGPKLDRVLSNGASGIYVGPNASYTNVDNNRIEYNGECGLAIGWGAVHVGIRGNSFHNNGTLGIDYGINGPSPAGPVPVPEITSAAYSDGKTIIEGRTRRTTDYRVTLYANDRPDAEGFGEGQYFLGEVEVIAGNTATFRFVHDGDLRGKFVAATITHLARTPYLGFGERVIQQQIEAPTVAQAMSGYDDVNKFTSEFSRAVEVK